MGVFDVPALSQAAGDQRYLRSVNGVAPDEDGNVVVSGGGSGGLSLVEDPPGSGLYMITGA